MLKLPYPMLNSAILITAWLGVCEAMPQAATSVTSSPTPSVSAIPWPTKIDALHEYILQQPDQNAAKGRDGPSIEKTFEDGDCLEVRFVNWDCWYDILYKVRGVAKFLDDTGVRNYNTSPVWDKFRYYVGGLYVDPDNGWGFYRGSGLSSGTCGHRGIQSACGLQWCETRDGRTMNSSGVPAGQSPYVDPSNRSVICPWLLVTYARFRKRCRV